MLKAMNLCWTPWIYVENHRFVVCAKMESTLCAPGERRAIAVGMQGRNSLNIWFYVETSWILCWNSRIYVDTLWILCWNSRIYVETPLLYVETEYAPMHMSPRSSLGLFLDAFEHCLQITIIYVENLDFMLKIMFSMKKLILYVEIYSGATLCDVF